MLTLLPLALSLTATAAEVTALPAQARGDVAIDYGVTVIPDTLQEATAQVGSRRTIDHNLNYRVRFGVLDMLALELELPHAASSRIRFSDATKMVYDPVAESGTMIGTASIKDIDRHGTGAEGMWTRLLGTPMSEDVFSSRGDQITWLVGLGYQFKDNSSFWNRNESGKRGAGPGSPALEVQSYWSTQNNMTEPYVGVVWTKRFATQTTTRNTNGFVTQGNVEIQDPSTIDIQTGMEIKLWSDEDWANGLGTEIALDLSGTFSYQTAGTVVSGVSLPSVLSLTNGQPVTQSEGSSLWGAGGVRWRIIRYLDWSINSALGAPLGRRLENPYNVASSAKGKMGWSIGTGFTFRMRDPIFDAK